LKDNPRFVIKGQKFDSSKYEKVVSLSRKWAQKRNWPRLVPWYEPSSGVHCPSSL